MLDTPSPPSPPLLPASPRLPSSSATLPTPPPITTTTITSPRIPTFTNCYARATFVAGELASCRSWWTVVALFSPDRLSSLVPEEAESQQMPCLWWLRCCPLLSPSPTPHPHLLCTLLHPPLTAPPPRSPPCPHTIPRFVSSTTHSAARHLSHGPFTTLFTFRFKQSLFTFI